MPSTAAGGDEPPSIGKARSRRDFLKISGFGLATVALLGASGIALDQITSTSALDLGIQPNDPGAGSQNRESLVGVLSNTKQNITFTPGDYYLDSTFPDIVIRNYGGEWTMQPGARLVFQDRYKDVLPSQESPEVMGGRGLIFEGNHTDGTGARFHGLRTTFDLPLPSKRVGAQECVAFTGTTDTMVRDADINGSHAAGLLFYACTRPSVDGAVIKNTMADGLHFANCQDAKANDLLIENTGDDGLAFLNYVSGPDNTGGAATNVTVRNSVGRGISVVGQSNVTIDGFSVDTTACAGLLCTYDSFWKTRAPSNVVFENGSVQNAGQITEHCPDDPKYGILYSGVGYIEFRDIRVVAPRQRGVSGDARAFTRPATDGIEISEPSGTIRLTNVEVQGAPEAGFALVGGTYYLDNLTARDVGNTGMFVGESESLSYGMLISINASKSNTLGQAFGFERNALIGPWEDTQPQELHVVDDQVAPTGYKIITSGTQAGTLGVIHDRVANGDLVVENPSGLSYTLGDAATPAVTPPVAGFVAPSMLGDPEVPVVLSWPGSDLDSGIARYELQQSLNGGAYSAVALPAPAATTITLLLAPGAYGFQVRAQDNVGNWSDWVGQSFTVGAYQENSPEVSYPGGEWTQDSPAGAYGGSLKYAGASGAGAKFVFTGRDVAWVSWNGSNRGMADVYVDGVKEATVDLYSGALQGRQAVFRKFWAAPGPHTLEVWALGQKNASSTSTHVDVDAFVIIA